MDIQAGTSGFQYKEWKGKFYPEKLPLSGMLGYYAGRFSSTEINYSFRQIPGEKTISTWSAATPEGFRFSFKAPQRVTHFAKLRDCQDTVEALLTAIRPMGGKLGAVLFQLPPTFKKDVPLLADFLAGLPGNIRPAFEFRHASWFKDEVYEALKTGGAALCLAEDGDLATPPEITTGFGYLRLRRLDYTPAELKRWARFVESQAGKWREAFVYFKHEDTGTGPEYAARFLAGLPSGMA